MEFSNQQYYQAFLRWYRTFPEKEYDQTVTPFLSSNIRANKKRGCLKAARQARLLSTGQVAEKLGISRPAYVKFEAREINGSISIEKLEELAEALDCELVYAIRPKNKMRFSVQIWKTLLPEALDHWWVQSRPEKMKAAALAAIAKRMIETPEIRRKHAWTKRKRVCLRKSQNVAAWKPGPAQV